MENPHLQKSLEAVRETIKIERDCLTRLMENLDESVAQAVELMFASEGQVIVTGMGKAGLIGRKIAATLASTGTPAYFLHPAEAIHGDLGIVAKKDVVLALSNSGETEEIVALLPHLKRFGVPIIALTGGARSTLAEYSDIALHIAIEKEADPLDIAPTASTTAQLAMGDALAAALVVRRGFRRDQYAIFHPGGSLGKKLLWLAEDLMHTGDTMPLVPPHISIRKAILEMSGKRLGACFVVDEKQTLLGILTDGDLRRLVEKDNHPWDHTLEEVMVKNPKTVKPGMLAAEAMKLMEEHAIMVLPVVDETGKAVGALHLHDLVKAGLA